MCSKKYFIVFRKMLAKKCINNNKSKLLFRFGQGKWIDEGVRCTKKIQVLELKNFKVAKFRFPYKSLYNYPKFKERISKNAKISH